MPLYSFKCIDCNSRLEYHMPHDIVPKVGRVVELKCVYCNKKKLKRVMDEAPAMKMGAPLKKEAKFDGWGWHDGLLKEFKGPKHYKEYLKQEGLTEYGNEGPPQYKEPEIQLLDDELLKDFRSAGIKFSDREAEALKTGEYQKSKEFKKDLDKLRVASKDNQL